MTIDLRETRLPGIGVKYAFTTARGARLVVILHNDGEREVYWYRRRSDDDPGAVIERPKIVEDLEMALGELLIEWIPVPEGSPAVGRTLADCAFRARTGITIIAILRDPEPVTGAQPHDVIQDGDTLVTVGKAGQYPAFRKLLAEGPFEDA